MTEDHGPRPGEIRAVNYRVGVTEDGKPIYKHRLEQYRPAPWGIGNGLLGQWKTIRVYDEGEDGALTEVDQ